MSATLQHNAAEQVKMFILDVMRHDDIEQLSSILRLMNNDACIGWREFWPHDFTPEEVIPALATLVQTGCVTAWREQEGRDELSPVGANQLDVTRDQENLWFALTDKGRNHWNQWEAPISKRS
jgi:hypothetical protein